MSIINGIDYGDLIFSKRQEFDKKAYEKYYNENFNYIPLEVDIAGVTISIDEEDELLTFNEWYGSEDHKKRIAVLLRKSKLQKIQDRKSVV